MTINGFFLALSLLSLAWLTKQFHYRKLIWWYWLDFAVILLSIVMNAIVVNHQLYP